MKLASASSLLFFLVFVNNTASVFALTLESGLKERCSGSGFECFLTNPGVCCSETCCCGVGCNIPCSPDQEEGLVAGVSFTLLLLYTRIAISDGSPLSHFPWLARFITTVLRVGWLGTQDTVSHGIWTSTDSWREFSSRGSHFAVRVWVRQ